MSEVQDRQEKFYEPYFLYGEENFLLPNKEIHHL
jgi:hypothetical protein